MLMSLIFVYAGTPMVFAKFSHFYLILFHHFLLLHCTYVAPSYHTLHYLATYLFHTYRSQAWHWTFYRYHMALTHCHMHSYIAKFIWNIGMSHSHFALPLHHHHISCCLMFCLTPPHVESDIYAISGCQINHSIECTWLCSVFVTWPSAHIWCCCTCVVLDCSIGSTAQPLDYPYYIVVVKMFSIWYSLCATLKFLLKIF